MKNNIFLLGLTLLLVSCNVNNPSENNSIDPSIENSKEEVSPTEEASPDLSYLSGKLNSSESIHYFGDGSYQTTKMQYYYYEAGDVSKTESTIIDESGNILRTINSEYEYKDGYLSKKIESIYIDNDLSEYIYKEFDSNENLIRIQYLIYVDEQTLDNFSYERFYEYDNENILIKIVDYRYLDIDTKYKYGEGTFKINGQNREEITNYYNADGTMKYDQSCVYQLSLNDNNDILDYKVFKYNDNNELYLYSNSYYEYDEHYNQTLVGVLLYDKNGELGYTRETYTSYEYDENSNVIKSEKYEYDENNSKINVNISEYEYDSNNNVVDAKYYKVNEEGITYLTQASEYEYDENGNYTKNIYTNYDEQGNVTHTSTVISEYDENNNCIYYKHIQNNDSYSYQISKYDENNNLIEYSSYDYRDGEEKLSSYTQYIYFE